MSWLTGPLISTARNTGNPVYVVCGVLLISCRESLNILVIFIVLNSMHEFFFLKYQIFVRHLQIKKNYCCTSYVEHGYIIINSFFTIHFLTVYYVRSLQMLASKSFKIVSMQPLKFTLYNIVFYHSNSIVFVCLI